MNINDPIAAAEQVLASEELARSPVHRYAALLVGWLPGHLGEALSKLLRREENEKLTYMVEVLKAEHRRVRGQVETLLSGSQSHREFAHQEWPALVIEGLRRAEQTRAKDRIARMAAILCNVLVEDSVPTADDVEEMMRIAMQLGDRDVLALKLVAESASGNLWFDRLSLQHALDLWKRIPWRGKEFSDSDVESVCSKLASFGLLARLDLPPNQNMMTSMYNGNRSKRLAQKPRR